jgi:hypothetical protein
LAARERVPEVTVFQKERPAVRLTLGSVGILAMDQKQDIIIALLVFIAVGLVTISHPEIKEHGTEIVIGCVAIIFCIAIAKVAYEWVRGMYWASRRFIDEKWRRSH